MNPFERHRKILSILGKTRYTTAEKLAAELGVSMRTIYYDISKLSCPYPIQTVPGRYGGGIKLADWFHPDAALLFDKSPRLILETN